MKVFMVAMIENYTDYCDFTPTILDKDNMELFKTYHEALGFIFDNLEAKWEENYEPKPPRPTSEKELDAVLNKYYNPKSSSSYILYQIVEKTI